MPHGWDSDDGKVAIAGWSSKIRIQLQICLVLCGLTAISKSVLNAFLLPVYVQGPNQRYFRKLRW